MRYVFRNIVRFPKKALVLFMLVSIILLLSLSGMFVITLCGEISDRTVGPLGGTVVVTDSDGERFMLYEAAKRISASSHVVDSVEAIAEYDVQPMGAKCINGEDAVPIGLSEYRFHMIDNEEWKDYPAAVLSRDMKLVGVTTTDICREFYSGNAELVEGSLISREDCDNELLKIVISDKFAELNGLKLGDSVKIDALSIFIKPSGSYVWALTELTGDDIARHYVTFLYEDYIIELGEELTTMTFTVGGIYRNLIDNKNSAATASDINDNRVYVPISVVSRKLDDINSDKTFNQRKDGYLYLGTLMPNINEKEQYLFPQDLRCVPSRLYLRLADMSMSDELEEAINEIGFYKEVKLTPFTNEAGTSPAAKILIIVRYSLLGVMAAGFAILLLVIIFNMNSRRREFAVLAALGMKRMKIALSFFGEVFVVFVAALLVCASVYIFTVRSVAAPVSEYLEGAEEAADSREFRMSIDLAENEAKKQRGDNMNDMGFLAKSYILPSLGITLAGTSAVFFIALIPVYFSMKKINPLTDSGGKE
ncbi:MAG: hypothetical protein J5940_02700 [Clostridia bacterium]|nr:hypothetical protein [Clostridia bacterium]